jgi:hypothetical protein
VQWTGKAHQDVASIWDQVVISWLIRKQTSVALSTAEAEYIAASVANREAVWLWKLLAGLFDLELEPTLIHCDNQSCVKLSENPMFHDKSKHIEIKYHYIRDMVQRGVVELCYISTDEQITNILTKPLSRVKYEYFRRQAWRDAECPPSLRGRLDVSPPAGFPLWPRVSQISHVR